MTKYLKKNYSNYLYFAEKEGFEPPDLLQSTVFKTAAIDHSAISPLKSNGTAKVILFFEPANEKNIRRCSKAYFGGSVKYILFFVFMEKIF